MQRLKLRKAAILICCCWWGETARAEEAPATDPRLVEAQAAFDEANKLREAGKYGDAIPRAERSCKLREDVLGNEHLDVARCLNSLGDYYRSQGDYVKAEPLIKRSLEIREKLLGNAHPDVAASVSALAILSYCRGSYRQAEALFKRSLEIYELLDKNHPNVADSLNGLAAISSVTGNTKQAKAFLLRSIKLFETTRGEMYLGLAAPLNSLANVYIATGDYGQAEYTFRRALRIQVNVLGENHPDVAATLNNLAILYHDLGDRVQAEVMYKRALEIDQEALGESSPIVAAILLNLAAIYYEEGDYQQADILYERALRINERILGADHPEVATVLFNFAVASHDRGQFHRAEQLHQRALRVRETAFGKSHALVAESLESLATLYTDWGKFDDATSLLYRVLRIVRKSSVNARGTASVFHNLGYLYRRRGRYAQAQKFYQHALAIQTAAFNESHPSRIKSLTNLGFMYAAQGNISTASSLLKQAVMFSEVLLKHEALGYSESRLHKYLESYRADLNDIQSMMQKHKENVDVRRLGLMATLLRKGRLVSELTDVSRTIYRGLGPEEQKAFARLRSLCTELSSLNYSGTPLIAAERKRAKELEEEISMLQAALAMWSSPLREVAAHPSPENLVPQVAAAIPEGGALIELVDVMERPLNSELLNRINGKYGRRYLGVILFPNEQSHAVDLGPAAPIDRAIEAHNNALADASSDPIPTAQALYHLVVAPLRPYLGTAKHLFISPDGQLNLVPFAALHDGTSYLLDAFDITYLTSGKDLLPHPADLTANAGDPVIFADPDFSKPQTTAVAPPAPQTPVEAGVLSLLDRSISLERFDREEGAVLQQQLTNLDLRLPASRDEANAIAKLFPRSRLYLGKEATTEALFKVAAPRILHLATHGRYLQDPTPPVTPADANTRSIPRASVDPIDVNRPPADPMLRAVLLLAGAKPVTALELSSLNLWGTELVVLSACESGQGSIQTGQGVFGLRRAFTVAGAETIVTSLWSADDTITRELMEDYYRGLAAGQGRSQAMREAMFAVRAKNPHPRFWAPFIVVGNSNPLRGIGSTGPSPVVGR